MPAENTQHYYPSIHTYFVCNGSEEEPEIRGRIPPKYAQRPVLPRRHLLDHRIRHHRDQLGQHLDAIEVPQMPGDLPRRHASRVHRDDLFGEAGEPPLVLADQRRIERPRLVAGIANSIDSPSVSTVLRP